MFYRCGGIIKGMNTFSDPQKVIDQLECMPGQHIADFGAGSGAYTFALAERMKHMADTKIFAIDIQKDLLARLESEATQRNYASVHVVWGDLETAKGSRLKDDSLDMVLVVNTLFQVDDQKSLMREAARVLKSGGTLVVVDWSESFGNIGPQTKDIVSEMTARTLATEAGCMFEHALEAGEHHYGFVARKK